jgi:LAO/AO transport system kinase
MGASDPAAAVLAGDVRAAARLITRIEAADPAVEPLLAALYARGGRTPIFGITGPPGAGKSTLVDQLLARLRGGGQRVAVLAVDPSSPYSGGAILGDRVRMSRHNTDLGVFIRSMAARGRLGGLARAAGDALQVLDVMGWDAILVETVGVGQNEIDILRHADTVVILQTPSSGDELQAAKAGLAEVGDVFVVNKSDAPGADRIVSALREALGEHAHQGDPERWSVPVLKTQAVAGSGVDELMAAMWAHREHLAAHPAQARNRRRLQVRAQIADRVSGLLRSAHVTAAEKAGFARWLDEVVERRCDPMTAARGLVRELS